MSRIKTIHIALVALATSVIVSAAVSFASYQKNDHKPITEHIISTVATNADVQGDRASQGFSKEDWRRLAKVL